MPRMRRGSRQTVLSQITYYRCHVGHQFGPQSLAAAQAETAEAKLWAAVAPLEETAVMARHLAGHAGLSGETADEQDRAADRAAQLAEAVRAQFRRAGRFTTETVMVAVVDAARRPAPTTTQNGWRDGRDRPASAIAGG